MNQLQDQVPPTTRKRSTRLFRDYLKRSGHICDASEIISKDCYEAWVASRGKEVGLINHPNKTFQRTLTAHLTGKEGCVPFTSDDEEAILNVIRVKRVWYVAPSRLLINPSRPEFEGTDSTIGLKGFRALASMREMHWSKKLLGGKTSVQKTPVPAPLDHMKIARSAQLRSSGQ